MRGAVAKRLRAEARRLATCEAMEVAPYGTRRTWKVVDAAPEQTLHERLSVEHTNWIIGGQSPQVRWAATSFRGQIRRLKREHRARRSAP